MLDLHRIPAEAAWMVGDSPVDWEAGLAAGVRAVAIVTDPLSAKAPERRAELGIQAYSSIRSWTEVALA
jgi:phosphoglycolate phosphatase-like HAD superfamily hydrolase